MSPRRNQVRLGEFFELAVAVRLPSSPILTEDDLTRTRSENVQVAWPESEPYVQLTVQVIAPACQIHGADSGKFRLYAGQDSPVLYFTLVPRQAGEIGLVVRLYQEDDWLGNARVRIVCGQVSGSLQVTQSPAASLEEQALWRINRTHLREMLKLTLTKVSCAHCVLIWKWITTTCCMRQKPTRRANWSVILNDAIVSLNLSPWGKSNALRFHGARFHL